jgi:hypothetical protein
MSAPNVDSILLSQASLLDKDINQRNLIPSTFWTSKAIKKGVWEDGHGINPRAISYEPTTPSSVSWETVALNDGGASHAVTAAADLAFASTTRAYMLQRAALQTPYITLDDVRLSHEFGPQLEACFKMAAQNTDEMWENRNRDEYVRLAEHKVIVKAGFTEDDEAFPLAEATGRVTGKVLQKFYRKILDQGGARDGGAVDMVNGQPQFIVVASPELNESIINDDYQIREDFRNSDRVNELLAPLGVERAYKGFYHVGDLKAPRWNFTDGAWVRVPYWTTTATTKGTMNIPNPAYETATHEDTIIYVPSVYECLVPKPLSKPGGNTDFDPHTYQGDWKWLNIKHQTENPDGNFGRFRGLFYAASRPINPRVGYVLRGLRPNIEAPLIDADGDVVA